MTQKNTFDGVSPNQETITLDGGGKRSATPYRFQDLPPLALAEIARRFGYGHDVRGYPVNNWRKLPFDNFINHGLAHVFAHMAGDTQDEHLSAAAWNIVCALEVYLVEKAKPQTETITYTVDMRTWREQMENVAKKFAQGKTKIGVDVAVEGGDFTAVNLQPSLFENEEQKRIYAAKQIHELINIRKDLGYGESVESLEYILSLLEPTQAANTTTVEADVVSDDPNFFAKYCKEFKWAFDADPAKIVDIFAGAMQAREDAINQRKKAEMLKHAEAQAEKLSKQVFMIPKFCQECGRPTHNDKALSAQEALLPCYCNNCGFNLKPHFTAWTKKDDA